MLKRLAAGLVAGLLLTVLAPAAALAIDIDVNGRAVVPEAPAVMEKGRVLVPVRAVFTALGATLHWDAVNSTVYAGKDNTLVVMKVGEQRAAVNDRSVYLEVPPRIMYGRVLVPLRFLSEALGCQVSWDGKTQTVKIDEVKPAETNGQTSASPAEEGLTEAERQASVLKNRFGSVEGFSEFTISIEPLDSVVNVTIDLKDREAANKWNALASGIRRDYLDSMLELMREWYPQSAINVKVQLVSYRYVTNANDIKGNEQKITWESGKGWYVKKTEYFGSGVYMNNPLMKTVNPFN